LNNSRPLKSYFSKPGNFLLAQIFIVYGKSVIVCYKVIKMRFKKVKPELVLVILLTVITIMSFNKIAGNKNNIAGGSVRGTVMPPEAGLRAFLFSGKDTLNVNVVNGAFQFLNVKTGNYKLMVEATPPYQNGLKDGISVTDGQFTDAGQLELQK
jgi:hypothetical protein